MIIAVVIIEFVATFLLALLIGANGNVEQMAIPLSAWLVLAGLQLTIHYLPRSQYARYGLASLIILILLVGVAPGQIEALNYLHQPLFIAGLGALPQFFLEWFSERTGRSWLFGLTVAALPLGVAAWSLAHIWIVKAEGRTTSKGSPYCIFVSGGNIFRSGYRQATNDLNLSGWNMVSGRGGGGSGNCCQWDFHALLLTNDKRLYNWSYRSQRFENVSERTKKSMALNNLSCQ